MLWIGRDTIVATMDGPKFAHELSTGDRLQDGDGIYRPILSMRRAEKKLLCLVRIRGIPAFHIDPEARAVTAMPEYRERRFVPSRITALTKWKDLEGGHSMQGGFVFGLLPYRGIGAVSFVDQLKHLHDHGEHHPSRLWKWSNTHIWYANQRRAPRIFRVTPRVAMFFGLFLADGTCTKKHMGAKFRTQSQIVSFAIADTQKYLAHFVQEQVERLYSREIKVRKSPSGACSNATFTFRPAIQMLAQCYDTGYNKMIPASWFLWPEGILRYVLRGWLLGDGCVKKNRIMTGSTMSAKLAFQMWWIALAAGYQTTIASYRQRHGFIGGRGNTVYQLSIPGRDACTLLSKQEPEELKRWSNMNYAPSERNSNGSVRPVSHGAFLRVNKVEPAAASPAIGIATRRYTSVIVNGVTAVKLVCGRLTE